MGVRNAVHETILADCHLQEAKAGMGEEQRRFQRIPEAFEVKCRHLGAFSETWRHVVTVDLSAGGLGFQSAELYDLSDSLEIQIRLPSFRMPLELRARLVRCTPMLSGVSECAVEFIDVTPDQQAEIDELVRFLNKRM